MQDHAKQRYIFGDWSLIRSLALIIPSRVATVRDLDKKSPSKKRFGYLLGHLSFWVSGMESPLIFLYTKKIRKNTNYKIHNWIVPFIDWIKLHFWKKIKKLHSFRSYLQSTKYLQMKTKLDLLNQKPKSEGYVTEWEDIRHPFRPDEV